MDTVKHLRCPICGSVRVGHPSDCECRWPPEATATPPEYPFKLDRHVYGEPASAWRKRAGLA